MYFILDYGNNKLINLMLKIVFIRIRYPYQAFILKTIIKLRFYKIYI